MTNEFNLSEKEIQDLQDHGFATVNGVPLSTLKIHDIGRMHCTCDRCKNPIVKSYVWVGNAMVCLNCEGI